MNLQLYIKEIRKKGHRAFTINNVIEHFGVSHNYAKVALHRLLKSGDVISPARGFYVIVPPEHQHFGSIPAEELIPLLMEHLHADYYVGLLSAAAFYGAAHQKVARFQVVSNKRIKHSLSFVKVEIEIIYKKSLTHLPIQKFVVNTGYLNVSTAELVALDLLCYPGRSGGLNHIATVLSELIENLDVTKLITLAQSTKVERQLQRIGYILEKIDVMDDDKKEIAIAKLEKFVDSHIQTYQPLASEIAKVGYPKCKKWKIIENTDVEGDL